MFNFIDKKHLTFVLQELQIKDVKIIQKFKNSTVYGQSDDNKIMNILNKFKTNCIIHRIITITEYYYLTTAIFFGVMFTS